jgi:glutathione peroxidase
VTSLGHSLADFSATSIDGSDTDLSTYAGQVALVVNVASRCGSTPQYAGLQQLYDDHVADGFVVLGFPCDQFGHQEPGSEAEIAQFCEAAYGVTFPMFAKVDVNGDAAHPLFRWLEAEQPGPDGADIAWNFTKFLLGRDGRVLARYETPVQPDEIAPDVEKALDPVSAPRT